MIIPKGKKVTFHLNGGLLPGTEGVDLLLDEDLTLNLSSQFGELVGGGTSKAFSVVGSVSRDVFNLGFSGQVKQLGFQVWQKTEPLSVSLTIAFNMITNAYNDVFLPVKTLIKLPLPDDGSVGDNGIGLIPPGPSILEAFGDNSNQRGKKLSCRIGSVRLPGIIVTQAQPTFSKETDQSGFPIYAKVVLDIRTIFTATTNLIDQMNYNTDGDGGV